MVNAALRLVTFGVLVSAIGCHKSVRIESEPSGARVSVNGVYHGVTPVRVSLQYDIFTTHNVELQKEGYRNTYAPIPSEGSLGVAICGYIICPALIIWARKPVSEAVFVLTAIGAGADDGMYPPPPPPPPPPAGASTPVPPTDAVTGASKTE